MTRHFTSRGYIEIGPLLSCIANFIFQNATTIANPDWEGNGFQTSQPQNRRTIVVIGRERLMAVAIPSDSEGLTG
jgi:hypothetical protein